MGPLLSLAKESRPWSLGPVKVAHPFIQWTHVRLLRVPRYPLNHTKSFFIYIMVDYTRLKNVQPIRLSTFCTDRLPRYPLCCLFYIYRICVRACLQSQTKTQTHGFMTFTRWNRIYQVTLASFLYYFVVNGKEHHVHVKGLSW